MANETKIVITAATAQAEGAIRTLGQSLDGAQKKMLDMSSMAGTLAGALTVTAFAGWINGSIDAADKLSELSQKTGTSVEDLAGLAHAAEQNGTSLESVAQAGKKLTASLVDKPELFAKMGVTATDSTGAMVQLADIFAGMPDGVEKTALAVKLMGKSGEEMIPFMNQGSESLRGFIDEGKKLNPVTAEFAQQAQDFNDNLDKMKMQMTGVGTTLASVLLPSFNDFIGGLKIIGVDAAHTAQQVVLAIEYMTSPSAWGNDAETAKFEARLKRLADLAEEEKLRIAKAGLPVAATAPVQDGRGKGLLGALGGGSGSPKQKADPLASQVASLDSELFAKQMELLGVSSAQIKVYELAMKGATKAQIEQAQATADSMGVVIAEIEAKKKQAEAVKKSEQDQAKAVAEANKIIFDIDPIAKATDEWAKLVALKEQGLLTDEQIGKAYAKTFGDVAIAGADTFAALEQASRGWGDAFTNSLVDMANSGSISFASLADSIIRDMERMVVQTMITKPLMDAAFGKNYGAGGNNQMGGFIGDLIGGFMRGSSGGAPTAPASVDMGGFYTPPAFAVGTDYVPRDMIAQIHEGERIVPKAFNPAIGNGGGTTINIINQNGSKVEAKESVDSRGQRRVDITIAEVVAGEVRRAGSSMNSAMRSTFGASPALVGR